MLTLSGPISGYSEYACNMLNKKPPPLMSPYCYMRKSILHPWKKYSHIRNTQTFQVKGGSSESISVKHFAIWATPTEEKQGITDLGKNRFKCCKMVENQDI